MRPATAICYLVVLITAIGCSVGWQPVMGIPGGQRRNIVGDPSTPGPFHFLLKVPAGARLEAHKHSTDVHVKVLRGSIFIIAGEPFDQARAQKYPAGAAFVVAADEWHVEWWEEPTTLEAQGVGPMDMIQFSTVGHDAPLSQ